MSISGYIVIASTLFYLCFHDSHGLQRWFSIEAIYKEYCVS